MQNNPSENYMNQKESRLVPNPEQLEDSISKNKTISKASEINVDNISTEQEIKNRRIVKIVGPKSTEDQKEKKLFVFNNTNKDLVNPANQNTTNLFSNPFLGSNKEKNDKPTLTHGLFGNLPQNNKNSTENIKKPEEDNKLGLFSGKQNTFERNFKKIFFNYDLYIFNRAANFNQIKQFKFLFIGIFLSIKN